jgi:cystathionine beta-lyase family protein involved in aluminum resistance
MGGFGGFGSSGGFSMDDIFSMFGDVFWAGMVASQALAEAAHVDNSHSLEALICVLK